MKQPTNPTSLSVLLKQAEGILTSPKASKYITLDDIEALSKFIGEGGKFLQDKVAKLAPSTKSNNNTYYNTNTAKQGSSNVLSRQERQPESPIVISSGDLLGTNFITDASISLYDISPEIEQQVSQSRDEIVDDSVDEVDVLNSIFESVKDVQE